MIIHILFTLAPPLIETLTPFVLWRKFYKNILEGVVGLNGKREIYIIMPNVVVVVFIYTPNIAIVAGF